MNMIGSKYPYIAVGLVYRSDMRLGAYYRGQVGGLIGIVGGRRGKIAEHQAG